MFDEPPPDQSQIGFTSRTRYFKPRYNYSWDWCPRFVPTGVWDSITIETGPRAAFHPPRVRTSLAPDNQMGSVEVSVGVDAPQPGGAPPPRLAVEIRDDEEQIACATAACENGSYSLLLDGLHVAPWWPNGHGEAKTYMLELSVKDNEGHVLWSDLRRIGFKRVEWKPCEYSPKDALPWMCVVNGKPIFLQGVNWTPVRLSYHDANDDEYRELISLYRDMGCTILRVWGGAMLEKEVFYNLCDQAGLLVWQDFPLSSSGIENAPPEDPEVIEDLAKIAGSYVERRAHHVSLLLWCGGNELRWKSDVPDTMGGLPVDETHPCIARLYEIVKREDPARRFVPSAPTGPTFFARPENFGKGIHHVVHGPYGLHGIIGDLEAWCAYWANEDALFRSESGMPGAASPEVFEYYSAGAPLWPPVDTLWKHSCAWWIQFSQVRDRVAGLDGDEAAAEYIRATQQLQAEAYRVAASCCKGRFPKCGGYILWMGHDCFPCLASNSVIDFFHKPKPAYYALQEVFRDSTA